MFQSAASVLPISRSPAMGLPVPSEGRGTGVMPLAMSQPRMVAPARPGGTKARYGWGLRSAITAKASRFILCHVTAMNGRDGISPSKVIFPEPTRLRRISYAVFCLKKKRHAGGAEQLQHAAQVGAAGEQVRGERVTEGVGAGLAAHVGAREDLAEEV